MANKERKAKGAVTNKAIADIEAEFKQQTVLTNTGTTQNITLQRNQSNSTGTPLYITIQSDYDVYFAWAPSTTDIISTSNSLWLPGGGPPIDLRVRWGAAANATEDTVVFQLQRKQAISTKIRYVIG
ncbi:MAG: hypothetical protein HOG49_00745 [Candidatus Scalindua sp.]|nr:hypothetical protein [Candidatus Scalindua sp.]